MGKAVSGSIPEKVIIVSGGQTQIESVWKELGLEGDIEREVVTPAFPVPSDSEKTLATAREWARGYSSRGHPVLEDPRDNEPFKDVRIVDLEVRNEGGRAWKVVTPDNYMYDMREDVLLDALIQVGCRPGGILNGEYVFARVHTQMKVIRVGSELYKALMEANVRNTLKKLNPKDLEPGGVYQTKAGKRAIFIGWVSYHEFPDDKEPRHVKKAMLWYHIDTYSWRDTSGTEPQAALNKALKDQDHVGFSICNSFAVIQKIDEVTVGKAIERFRGHATKGLTEQLRDIRARGYGSRPSVGYWGPKLTVVPFGEEPVWGEWLTSIYGSKASGSK